MHFWSNKCTFYSLTADSLAAVTVTNVLKTREKIIMESGEWNAMNKFELESVWKWMSHKK